jgi:hypothetical protein
VNVHAVFPSMRRTGAVRLTDVDPPSTWLPCAADKSVKLTRFRL